MIHCCTGNREIVRRSDVNGVEAIVVDSAPLPITIHQVHKPAQSLQKTNVDEILITEVHLPWNQRISIAKRDRRTIEELWEEVSKATNGKYLSEDAKRKWKNLRD
ncbi:hypothetical protein ALC62_11197 [Cyphomyrmex costatus]|uniref:MADF domain-containing protein n=1 Tax=Cyphomyrmex costatus TaxID=456900 RepID=A0A151ICP4_9HYME|nr:hypothetical protein ALC62_11197 [Cyphomyrmex costatus]